MEIVSTKMFGLMLKRTEDYEESLKYYSLKSKNSNGKNDNNDIYSREEHKPLRYHTDYMRIMNSRAFRRLRGKTQVFGPAQYDPPRCRLSHTLEVTEASRIVARLLEVNEAATVAIALGHDLGHSPFGHSGERALHKILRKQKKRDVSIIGGFKHNWQSLRVADSHQFERSFYGFNLSNEVREGIVKHYKIDVEINEKIENLTNKQTDILYISGHDRINYNPGSHLLSIKGSKPLEKKEMNAFLNLLDAPTNDNYRKIDEIIKEFNYECRYPDIDNEDEKELFLNSPYPSSIEGQVVHIVDKIISAVHDVEDAYKLKLVTWNDLYDKIRYLFPEIHKGANDITSWKTFRDLSKHLDSSTYLENECKVAQTCRILRLYLMNSLIEGTLNILEKESKNLNDMQEDNKLRKFIAETQIVSLMPNHNEPFKKFKDWINSAIINSDMINEADARAEGIISRLYYNHLERPLLLPKYYIARYELYIENHWNNYHENQQVLKQHEDNVGVHYHCTDFKQEALRGKLEDKIIKELKKDPIFHRVIVDYIAGMTDQFAFEKTEELFEVIFSD